MKIQELAIIFIIIILPISLLLAEYTQFQIKTISLQTEYDTKLTSATYDAIKAYQLNSVNETYRDIANENLEGLEASVAAFRNSIITAFNLNGYTKDELDNYIPALVYTLYDGFYIYSPYVNNNYLDENGNEIPNQPIDNDAEKIYGLKPYIKYSCRYETPDIDVVITYALDNYITVQGIINNEYVNKSGYLIEGIEILGDEVTYNGVKIQTEHLKENVLGEECSYVKINGIKYYLIKNGNEKVIATISNGTLLIDNSKTQDIDKWEYFMEHNDSAIQYYVQAKEFTDWFKLKGLANLKYENAIDEVINEDGTTEITNLWSGNQTNIFNFNTGLNIENETSEFNQHRLAIIRHKIETNLAIAISNYNEYSGVRSNVFQMPELKENEWQHITHNICLMSFLQGLPIGGKIYNGYTLVTNSENTEVVQEEYIYILGKNTANNTYSYHKVNDIGFTDGSIEVSAGIYGDNYRSAGRLNLDFRRNTIGKENVGTFYYYSLKDYNASYDSIVMQNNVLTYDDIYKYVNECGNNNLKQAFYIALGRERAGKFNNEIYIDLAGSGLQPLPPEEAPPVKYWTITYNAEDAEGWMPIEQTVMEGQAKLLEIKPDREGYEFVGWNTGVKTYNLGDNIEVKSNIILNAIWKTKSYNVTLYADGGMFIGDSDGKVSRTYNHNEEINREDLVDEPIRDGYEFLGWSEISGAADPQYEKDIKINCTKDMELYAVWKEVTYIITYDANGGFGLEQSVEVVTGESVKLITNPYTRNGYQFLGWSTSPSSTSAEYFAGKQFTPTKSTILYAVWKKTMPDAEITPIKPVIPDAEIM